MISNRITWIEVDADAINLPPAEALTYYTTLSSRRAPGEPWAAFLRPIPSENELYCSLGISLVAQYEFSPEVIDAFSQIAVKLTDETRIDENEWIKAYQRSRGNPEHLWDASESGLEIILPARFVPTLKNQVEKIFADASQVVVEVPEDRQ